MFHQVRFGAINPPPHQKCLGKRNHLVGSHLWASGVGTLLGCPDHHAEIVGTTAGPVRTRKQASAMNASKSKRGASFSKGFALPDPSRAASCAAYFCCGLKIGETIIIDSHPYSGQAICGYSYLFFRIMIRSGVNSFLSLHAGVSPHTPALSFLSSRPGCGQRIRAQTQSTGPHP